MSYNNQGQQNYGGHQQQGGHGQQQGGYGQQQGGYNQQQGGYGAPPPQQQGGYGAPPPQQQGGASQQELWNWFQSVDTDKSGKISAEELQRALVNGDWTPFSFETVRLLLNMFDRDQTGKVEFNEFTGLWGYVNTWKQLFLNFDRDRSGFINTSELKNALDGFGFQVSDNLIKLISFKFDRNGNGNMSFDTFIQACVTVKTLTDSFKRLDNDNNGSVQLRQDQFLELFIANK